MDQEATKTAKAWPDGADDAQLVAEQQQETPDE
jgi:hypothetical protein